MSKRLVIDLDKWRSTPDCTASCSYYYHPDNDGVLNVVELASFEVFCRRCELKSCVNACRYDALKTTEDDGMPKRSNMLCTGCESCSQACPFGIIVPTTLRYIASICDECIGRRDDVPECVQTCSCDAIKYEEVPEDAEDTHLIGDFIAAKSRAWQKSEPLEEKK